MPLRENAKMALALCLRIVCVFRKQVPPSLSTLSPAPRRRDKEQGKEEAGVPYLRAQLPLRVFQRLTVAFVPCFSLFSSSRRQPLLLRPAPATRERPRASSLLPLVSFRPPWKAFG